MKFDMTKEYKTKRERDQALEAWLRGELEKAYKVKGLSPEYNTIENSGLKGEVAKKQVKDLELKGFDVKLSYGGKEPIICDEKAFTSKISEAYTDSKTFAFEVSSTNNKGGGGWLFKDDCICSHYMLAYPEVDISGELRRIELICISRETILDKVRELGFTDRKEVEDYLEKYGTWEVETDNVKQRAKINDIAQIVYSEYLSERPVNIVIDRDWIREHAYFIIDIPDMRKIEKEYEEMMVSAKEEKSPEITESPRDIKGIKMTKQAEDVFKKLEKEIPKLRGCRSNDFIPMEYSVQEGTKLDITFKEFARTNNVLVFKGVSSEGKEVYIPFGGNGKTDFKNLSFSPLKPKWQVKVPVIATVKSEKQTDRDTLKTENHER